VQGRDDRAQPVDFLFVASVVIVGLVVLGDAVTIWSGPTDRSSY
jgi:hypothetical protein